MNSVATIIPIRFSTDVVPASSESETAMQAAREAQLRWAHTPIKQRLSKVRVLRGLIAEHALKLAQASADARNRPAFEALTAEVLPLAEACRFLERNAARLLKPCHYSKRGLPIWLSGISSQVHREPLGVVLIIGPGNYPLLLPGVQLIQALVAGNAVLLKPGVGGTPVARALCELVVRAGFDPGLVALLPDSVEAARSALEAGPDKVIFTGSTEVGKNILTEIAPALIPATMELSGSDAVIIRADADLELAAKGLVFGLTLNEGATCMAPKRVFVASSRVTELEGRLADLLAVASPIPTVSKAESRHSLGIARLLRRQIEDALGKGAHLLAGSVQADGSLVTPLVVSGVSAASRLLQADHFLPVLAIVTIRDDAEAIRLANDSAYGLAASIFSHNEAEAHAMAAQLRTGLVTINDLIVPSADPRLPFGGRGRSGFGVTRGAEGLLELTRPKVVTVSRGSFRPAFQTAHQDDESMACDYARVAHGYGFKRRWLGLLALGQKIFQRAKATRQTKP